METHKPAPRAFISCAIDDVALASLRSALQPVRESGEDCHVCGSAIAGEPAGRGLFLWTRGDEVRVEEPPLCAGCATAIGVTALREWEIEEDEG